MNKVFPLFLLIMVVSADVCSGKTTAVFQFLKIPVSAQLTSLGCVNSASTGEASVILQNPSFSVFIPARELSFGGVSYLGGVLNSFNVSAVFPLKNRSAYGFSLLYYGSEHTKVDAPSSGYAYIEGEKFLTYNISAGGFYAHMVGETTSLGISAKLLTERLYSAVYTGFAIDASITEMVDRTSLFCLGVKSLGFAFNTTYLPPTIGYLSVIKRVGDGSFVIEGEQDIFNRGRIKIGAEFPIQRVFILRAGFHHPFNEHDTGNFILSRITAGFGIRSKGINFNYAFYPKGELSNSHYITLGIKP